MPLYEIDCASRGPFERLRPISSSAQPRDCPDCGTSSKRVILTMPAILGMDG